MLVFIVILFLVVAATFERDKRNKEMSFRCKRGASCVIIPLTDKSCRVQSCRVLTGRRDFAPYCGRLLQNDHDRWCIFRGRDSVHLIVSGC